MLIQLQHSVCVFILCVYLCVSVCVFICVYSYYIDNFKVTFNTKSIFWAFNNVGLEDSCWCVVCSLTEKIDCGQLGLMAVRKKAVPLGIRQQENVWWLHYDSWGVQFAVFPKQNRPLLVTQSKIAVPHNWRSYPISWKKRIDPENIWTSFKMWGLSLKIYLH